MIVNVRFRCGRIENAPHNCTFGYPVLSIYPEHGGVNSMGCGVVKTLSRKKSTVCRAINHLCRAVIVSRVLPHLISSA